MWYLTDLQGQNKRFLLPDQKCIVGRKLVDLVLSDDQSISRRHAFLNVVGNAASVTDSGSKYGTWIQTSPGSWNKLAAATLQELTSGDIIRFGLQTHIWRIQNEEMITTTSNLKADLKADLKKTLMLCGGQLKGQWIKQCTHLTMSQITLTVKAVCAMASGSPIVTPQYWKCYYDSITENKQLPDANEFLPPVAEQTINTTEVSFAINENRKNMFAGKLFVFATQARLKELSPMIIAAGGTATELTTSGLSLQQLTQPHVVVVSYFYNPSQEPESSEFSIASKHLMDNGLRAIPESEIGLAVLYCSMEKYCNPAHDFTNSILANCDPSPSTLSRTTVLDLTSQVLAYDTQETQSRNHSQIIKTQNVIIPESGMIASSSKDADNETIDLLHSQQNREHRASNVSPIKKKPGVSDDLFNRKTQNKRIRELEINEQCSFKKPNIGPQPSSVAANSGSSNSTTRKRVTNSSDIDKDFEFPSTKKSKSSKQNQNNTDESFEFPESSKRKPSSVNKTPSEDKDFFELSSSSLRPQQCLNDDEDMFGDYDGHAIRNEVNPADTRLPPHCVSNQQTQIVSKRKTSSDFETPARQFAPYRAGSTIAQPPLKSSVSLQGFLNAADIKNEMCELEDLADEVLDLVLIEEMPLVVRRSTTPTALIEVGMNETEVGNKNFKKFRKVQHLNKTILPRIIGGRDLSVHLDDIEANGWNKAIASENDSNEDSTEEDGWAFPTRKNGVGQCKVSKRRVRS